MKILIFSVFVALTFSAGAQGELAKIVNEGIALHDQKDYVGAIRKYDAVLAQDSNHFDANYEKAYSLSMLHKYNESIAICTKLARLYDQHPQTKNVYVAWGNALDNLERPDEALVVYDNGLLEFPEFHLLHFNKAVTYGKMGKAEECKESVQEALRNNGVHASSHNLLGILMLKENKIASLLASLTFLGLEPASQRSLVNLARVENILGGNVTKKGENEVTVNIDPGMLDEKKDGENDFSSVELLMAMTAGLDMDDKYKKENKADKLARKMGDLIQLLWETRKDGKGFFWTFYVPFFHEMKKKGFLEVYSHLATAAHNDKVNQAWLDKNTDEVNKFYEWVKKYKWHLD